MNRPTIVYHIPWKLNETRLSASQLRPKKMFNAFLSLGYNILPVMGNCKEKKKNYCAIQNFIRYEGKILFCYSESSTQPTLFATGLTDFFNAPFIDYKLFYLLKKNKVPIGLFLRDIYWVFPEFNKINLSAKLLIKKIVYKFSYIGDCAAYNCCVDTIFLPSFHMIPHISKYLPSVRFAELPPGVDKNQGSIALNQDHTFKDKNYLTCLYVGGIGNHYKIHEIFKCFKNNPSIGKLIVCTRKDDWEKAYREYASFLAPNIKIIHLNKHNIADIYAETDICLAYFKNSIYMDFAMPYKIFEYMQFIKPVIATEGTAAGDFILKNSTGWSLPYDSKLLMNCILSIKRDLHKLSNIKKNIIKVLNENSWKERAISVSEQLRLTVR